MSKKNKTLPPHLVEFWKEMWRRRDMNPPALPTARKQLRAARAFIEYYLWAETYSQEYMQQWKLLLSHKE